MQVLQMLLLLSSVGSFCLILYAIFTEVPYIKEKWEANEKDEVRTGVLFIVVSSVCCALLGMSCYIIAFKL